MNDVQPLYGLMAEFASPERLVQAARAAHAAGYRRMDAYAPFHIEELPAALGSPKTRLPALVLIGGVFGALSGYALQIYCNVIALPYDVGGRPLHSWPAFVPVTFELTILCAALAATLGMLARNGLPRPYHPVFNAPRFALASRSRFLLCIEASDPKFERDSVRRFLESLDADDVAEVWE